ncbi:MAG: hypothetical protein HQK77_17675 [Desulfobacterales bacterium]|nr:hypothetical protein [Desulfobacterales bacterium]
MINKQLQDYITQQLQHGVPNSTISDALMAKGWKLEQVQEALLPLIQPPSNSSIKKQEKPVISSLVYHIIGYGIILIIARVALNTIILSLLTLMSVIRITFFPSSPSELTPYQILPFFTYGALFIFVIIIAHWIRKKYPLNYLYILVISSLSLTLANVYEYLLCSISFFCTRPDIQDMVLTVISCLSIIFIASLFSKYYKKTIWWLILLYCVLFITLYFVWIKIQDTHVKNNSFTYQNTYEPSQFEQYSMPNTSISFFIPKAFSQTKHYNSRSTDSGNKNADDIFNKEYPKFQTNHELTLQEDINNGATTYYYYNVLLPKESSKYGSDKEFLNSCSYDSFDGVYELCEELNQLIKLDNGITYCKAYNPRLRGFDQGDAKKPLSLQSRLQKIAGGAFLFEDTSRIYIAKPTQGYNYCFVMEISNHETRYTDSSTVDNLADYTMRSIHITDSSTTQEVSTPSIPIPSMVPTKTPLETEKNETAPQCPNPIVDGMCQLNNCSYSYPNTIYLKGKAIVGKYYDNPDSNTGISSGTYYDECTFDGKQVKEVQCYGDLYAPRTLGYATYDCPKGCSEGVCIQ